MKKISKIPLIIVGTGGHARVAYDIASLDKKIKILGFIDIKPPEKSFIYPYLGDFSKIEGIKKKNKQLKVFVAIGDNSKRMKVVKECEELNLSFISLIHPQAIISASVKIGEGCAIMAGAILNPHTFLGRHCIVNTGAILDHDCHCEDFSSLAPAVVCGGEMHLGEASALGLGAHVLHGITIGSYSVIGAGSVVTKNLEQNIVAYGVPAQKIRDRQPTDPYL